MNLLMETKDDMKRYYNKTLTDIDYINLCDKGDPWEDCVDYRSVGWTEFTRWAKQYSDYDAGYGAAEVPEITIVFKDGSWLSRWEYDGSEGWRMNKKPRRYDDDSIL